MIAPQMKRKLVVATPEISVKTPLGKTALRMADRAINKAEIMIANDGTCRFDKRLIRFHLHEHYQ